MKFALLCLLAADLALWMFSFVRRPRGQASGKFFSRLVSKTVLLDMLLAAAVLLWKGPRPMEVLPADRQRDVVLQYWEKWNGPEGDAMRRIVDDFNNTVGREKHIYVQYMSITAINQKTLVATAAGVPPDIAGLWDQNFVQFAALGAIQPVDSLAKQYGIDASYYKPVFWKGVHYQGHMYGLISTPAAIALFYNKRIFHENAGALRKAGLDPDRAPQTLQELDRYADALDKWTVHADGTRHLERAGYLPMEPGWYITFTPIWFGTDVYDPLTQTFRYTDPRVVRAFEWVRSYSLKYGKAAYNEFASAQGTFNSPTNAFICGNVAMEQQGPWMANFIHINAPQMDNDWAAAPFPSATGQKDVTYCPFDALAIPVGAKHPRESFAFMAFVNRQDEMEKLCALQCKNSPLRKVSAAFYLHHPNHYIRVFDELAASPNAVLSFHNPVYPEAFAELTAAAQGIATLELQPRPALEHVQQAVTAMWDEYKEKEARRAAAGK